MQFMVVGSLLRNVTFKQAHVGQQAYGETALAALCQLGSLGFQRSIKIIKISKD